MAGTKRVDVRLLSGKSLAVTIGSNEDVLVIGGGPRGWSVPGAPARG
jgi:hypothetical protein